jgi:hypothetical protein
VLIKGEGVRALMIRGDQAPQSKAPDGDPHYVWPGCALVRPGRCDVRCSWHSAAGPAPPTSVGCKPTRWVHRRRRTATLDPYRGTRTRSETNCPTQSRCSTPSMSSASGRRSSTRSAAASNKTPLGHRGHKNDPLYQVCGPLRRGVERLTERQDGWNQR